jgi:hypothetical protein
MQLTTVIKFLQVSKICSTPTCDQMVPAESRGSRCISCVKLDWKLIKDRFKTSGPCHQHRAENTLPSAFAKPGKVKLRKSVTWSGMVTIAWGDGKIIRCPSHNVEDDRLSVSDDIRQDGEGVNTLGDEQYTSSKMDVVSSTNTRPRTMETRENNTGWDSDLSEVTQSNKSDNVRFSFRGSVHALTICQSPQISVPTGLKIKIPARSTIVSRKCKNPSCRQVLATYYPGKTCLTCRVHRRQIQQRRKGIHDEVCPYLTLLIVQR